MATLFFKISCLCYAALGACQTESSLAKIVVAEIQYCNPEKHSAAAIPPLYFNDALFLHFKVLQVSRVEVLFKSWDQCSCDGPVACCLS